MRVTESTRTVRVNLETRELIHTGWQTYEEDEEMKERARERYAGLGPFARPRSGDPFEWVPVLMERAKLVLSIDKYHLEMVFLLDDEGIVRQFVTMPEDQRAKYVFLTDVSAEVRRTGATGLVLVADSWYVTGDVDLPEGMRPSDLVDQRKEALMVTGAKSDGSTFTLVTPYERGRDDTITFGETVESSGGEAFLFPVMQAWGVSGFSEQEVHARAEVKSANERGRGESEATA
jgi:hypothetical protein